MHSNANGPMPLVRVFSLRHRVVVYVDYLVQVFCNGIADLIQLLMVKLALVYELR